MRTYSVVCSHFAYSLLIFVCILSRCSASGTLGSDFVSGSLGLNFVSTFQRQITFVAMFSRTKLYDMATCFLFKSWPGLAADVSTDSLSLCMLIRS